MFMRMLCVCTFNPWLESPHYHWTFPFNEQNCNQLKFEKNALITKRLYFNLHKKFMEINRSINSEKYWIRSIYIIFFPSNHRTFSVSCSGKIKKMIHDWPIKINNLMVRHIFTILCTIYRFSRVPQHKIPRLALFCNRGKWQSKRNFIVTE